MFLCPVRLHFYDKRIPGLHCRHHTHLKSHHQLILIYIYIKKKTGHITKSFSSHKNKTKQKKQEEILNLIRKSPEREIRVLAFVQVMQIMQNQRV